MARVTERWESRRDTWTFTTVTDPRPAPGGRLGDVTSTTVRHARSQVQVTVRFRALAATGAYASYDLRIQGDRVVREVVLEAGRGRWAGRVRVFRRDGDPAAGCGGVRHRIDYRHDRVRIVVPRGCLHRPHRVRANLNVYRAGRDGRFWSDSAQTRRAHSDAWTRWLRRG